MFGFNLLNSPFNYSEHSYSLAATGIKLKEMTFNSRQEANSKMYNLCEKYGLKIVKTYDDKHDKTYICDNGVRFYIQRI